MFVRDARTGNLLPGQMTWLSGMGAEAAVDPTWVPVQQHLHWLAMMMPQFHESITRAIAALPGGQVDIATLAENIQVYAEMQADWNATITGFRAANPYAAEANLAHDPAAFAAEWARASVQTLPAALDAVPDWLADRVNAILDALGKMAGHAGTVTFTALLPFFAIGAAGLVFLKYAERSRTWRKRVA